MSALWFTYSFRLMTYSLMQLRAVKESRSKEKAKVSGDPRPSPIPSGLAFSCSVKAFHTGKWAFPNSQGVKCLKLHLATYQKKIFMLLFNQILSFWILSGRTREITTWLLLASVVPFVLWFWDVQGKTFMFLLFTEIYKEKKRKPFH